MKKGLMIIILILIVKSSFGQQFTDLYGDYLGQIAPGDTPVVFAPGIISRNSMELSAAIFSSDGNEVYWNSDYSKGMKLWFMKRINNRWTNPKIFAPFGDSLFFFGPFLSIDGKRLYFSADRYEVTKNKDGIGSSDRDLWYIEKQDNEWSKPQSLSSVINTVGKYQQQASYTRDGTVYFFQGQGSSLDRYNIFRSKFKNGNYLPADSLPECINSPLLDRTPLVFEETPFIASDDSYLIFSSSRPGTKGSGDLYISFHDIKADTWSEPINMGEPINTWSQERFPTVSPDGKYLFFTRWTQENNHDIFWVSAKIIDRLREKNNMKK